MSVRVAEQGQDDRSFRSARQTGATARPVYESDLHPASGTSCQYPRNWSGRRVSTKHAALSSPPPSSTLPDILSGRTTAKQSSRLILVRAIMTMRARRNGSRVEPAAKHEELGLVRTQTSIQPLVYQLSRRPLPCMRRPGSR